jgi:hypothetical protein
VAGHRCQVQCCAYEGWPYSSCSWVDHRQTAMSGFLHKVILIAVLRFSRLAMQLPGLRAARLGSQKTICNTLRSCLACGVASYLLHNCKAPGWQCSTQQSTRESTPLLLLLLRLTFCLL